MATSNNDSSNNSRNSMAFSSMTSFLRVKEDDEILQQRNQQQQVRSPQQIKEEEEEVEEEEENEDMVLGDDSGGKRRTKTIKGRRNCFGCRRAQVDVEEKERKRRERAWVNDYRNSTFVTRLFFSWCSRLERETLEREVEVEDLWEPMESQKCSVNTRRVRSAWSDELKRNPARPSLFKTLLRAFKYDILVVGMYKTLWLVMILLTNALFFNSTLQVLQNFSADASSVPTVSTGDLVIPYTGLFWALGFGASDICRSLFISAHWWKASVTGQQARIGVANLVFEKLVRTRQVNSVGQVVTHTTKDVQRILDAFTYGIFVISTPVSMIAIVVIGSFYLSVAFVVGLGLLILFLPVQVKISSKSQEHHRKAVKVSTERVTLMSEILRAIKLVKLYGWGANFSAKVNQVRQVEMKELRKGAFVKSTNQAFSFVTPPLVIACSFAIHTLVLNRPLLASEAFTTVALLNAARFPLSILPNSTRCLSEAIVACRRLENFLCMDNDVDPTMRMLEQTNTSSFSSSSNMSPQDDKTTTTSKQQEQRVSPGDFSPNNSDLNSSKDYVVWIEDGEFSWYEEQPRLQKKNQQPTNDDDQTATRVKLYVPSLKIPKGKLTCVVGKLGSGKSSLLAGALLGEMRMDKCTRFDFPAAKQGVAYVSQNPFIFNGTVRSNILLNRPEDSLRLAQVIEACCLEADLAQFPGGLETELGERGINGSGGQKARIALARALYAAQEKEMIILDDVFSALDAHVKKQVWQHIRYGDLLKGKTIVLATHWGEILHECDLLVPLSENRVFPLKTFQELTENGEMDEFLLSIGCVLEDTKSSTMSSTSEETPEEMDSEQKQTQHQTTASSDQDKRLRAKMLTSQGSIVQGRLVKKEQRAKGEMATSTVTKLVFRRDLRCFTMMTLITLIVNEAVIALGSSLWISSWTQDFFNETNAFYVGILFAITGVMFILSEIRGLMFATMMLRGAQRIHDDAFATMMNAKLSFFDVTPMGRVLSRFSADMDTMDVTLPEVVETSFSLILRSVFSLITIAVIFVYFLIPLFVLCGLFLFFFFRFRPSMRMLKRIDATARSPILSLVESTAHGLTTLRAFGELENTKRKAEENWDMMFKTSLGFNASSRFMAVRLDLITSFSTVITACFCVLFASKASPGLAGLALTSVLQTGGVFQFAIRQLMEAESMFSSVERLVQFSENVPKEPEYVKDPPYSMDELESFQLKGEIVFHHVVGRYRARLPLVLNGLDLTIPAGTTCGLVGRTGSGKSSCLLALFRIFNIDAGSITVDGLDVGRIPIHFLRSRILSIIPQDPSLFRGTMRSNLDPFDAFSDAEVRDALEKVHLRDSGCFENLDKSVDEAGGNLSQGERQLFCLARALLRKTPIVCLDECTSSVDSEKSKLIGETLKQLFKSRTLIIVAHRLDVVSSLDQVCVLDAGRCVERGDPKQLIASKQGKFYDLWTSAQADLST